jgi:hypothetical protein
MNDTLKMIILEDGTIRTETDRVSAPNHQSAEAFLSDITRATGGEATRTRKAHGHHHQGHAHHVHTDGQHTHEE